MEIPILVYCRTSCKSPKIIVYSLTKKFDLMIKDAICCNPRKDTFLAVTEIRPLEPEVPKKTSKELQKIEENLIEALYDYKHIVFDLSARDSIEKKETLDETFLQNKQNNEKTHTEEKFKIDF